MKKKVYKITSCLDNREDILHIRTIVAKSKIKAVEKFYQEENIIHRILKVEEMNLEENENETQEN